MAAFGYTLTAVNDIALSASITNLFADQGGRVLAEPSLVTIALNGEDVDVSAGIRLGPTEVLSAGSRVTLQPVVGTLTILPDDIIAQVIGERGDELIISGRNADAAAARELRGVAIFTPISDVDIQKALQPLRVIGGG